MPIALFFNTEYFNVTFDNHTVAAQKFSEMVLGLKAAINHGAENYLVSAANAVNTVLSFNYSVRDWIADRRKIDDKSLVDRDLQRYFASKISKAPYCEDRLYQNNDDFLENEVEVDYLGESVANLSATLAYLNAGILISPSLSAYNGAFIRCSVNHLVDDKYEASLRCINSEETFQEHIDHIRISAGIEITNAIDIWTYKATFFPNLEFCERVEEQLASLTQWKVVLDRLFELEKYSRNWTLGPFNFTELPSKTSPEGEQVRHNQRAQNERRFLCPDGQHRFFNWHQRATPGAIRVYFYPMEDAQNCKIIVGHIGDKPYYP